MNRRERERERESHFGVYKRHDYVNLICHCMKTKKDIVHFL